MSETGGVADGEGDACKWPLDGVGGCMVVHADSMMAGSHVNWRARLEMGRKRLSDDMLADSF
jgi:hypothetical protein